MFFEKILPFVRPGGSVMIAVPGLGEQPTGKLAELFTTWAEGDDAELFKTIDWWRELLTKECGDACEITVKEGGCFAEAWQDWFDSGHEYGARDKEFLEQGLDQILNFILIYVKKR